MSDWSPRHIDLAAAKDAAGIHDVEHLVAVAHDAFAGVDAARRAPGLTAAQEAEADGYLYGLAFFAREVLYDAGAWKPARVRRPKQQRWEQVEMWGGA